MPYWNPYDIALHFNIWTWICGSYSNTSSTNNAIDMLSTIHSPHCGRVSWAKLISAARTQHSSLPKLRVIQQQTNKQCIALRCLSRFVIHTEYLRNIYLLACVWNMQGYINYREILHAWLNHWQGRFVASSFNTFRAVMDGLDIIYSDKFYDYVFGYWYVTPHFRFKCILIAVCDDHINFNNGCSLACLCSFDCSKFLCMGLVLS